jgi:hypothetical protein
MKIKIVTIEVYYSIETVERYYTPIRYIYQIIIAKVDGISKDGVL